MCDVEDTEGEVGRGLDQVFRNRLLQGTNELGAKLKKGRQM